MRPERGILDAGGHYALRLLNGNTAEIDFQPDGKSFVLIDEERHEADLSDAKQVAFKNIRPWLILSHSCRVYPFSRWRGSMGRQRAS